MLLGGICICPFKHIPFFFVYIAQKTFELIWPTNLRLFPSRILNWHTRTIRIISIAVFVDEKGVNSTAQFEAKRKSSFSPWQAVGKIIHRSFVCRSEAPLHETQSLSSKFLRSYQIYSTKNNIFFYVLSLLLNSMLWFWTMIFLVQVKKD